MSLNYFVFDGESSLDYGVYIGGQNTYNAPERDVTKVSIPGRNGDLIQDNGRFLNVQVPYTIVVMDEFRDKTDAIKAWLLSKTGYCKLADTYHPGTYRLARVTGGIDFETSAFNATGKTQVIFDCKPERFLDSGDEVINVGVWGQTEVRTGDIVTFTAQENTRIKRTSVAITPSQSLNGYEYPWPGGGGKNLFNKADTAKQIDGASFSNGAITTASSTGRLVAYIDCKPNTTYTVSRQRVSDNERFQVGYTTSQPANEVAVYEVIAAANSGTIGNLMSLTLTTGPNAAFLVVWAYWGGQTTALDTLQIEYGTSASLFAPYSNICPISGYTGAAVSVAGKNLVNVADYEVSRNAYYQDKNTDYRLFPNIWYTFSMTVDASPTPFRASVGLRKPGGTYSYDIAWQEFSAGGRVSITFRVTNEAILKERPYFAFRCPLYAVATDFTVSVRDIQLEIGTSATPYEPYQSSAHPISWQTEAGTVYCGSVDVVSGQLTVTHKSVTFNGSENWSWSQTYGGRASMIISDMKSGSWYSDSNTKCDSFPKISALNDYGVVIGYDNNGVYFEHMGDHLPGVTDKTTWQAWLSNNNVTITYPLATPLTYDLTPTAINTLLGQNNVWGDIGAVTVEWGENPNAILNPTRFVSKPKMRVIGSGSGIITIDAGAISVSNLNEYVDIDSDLMNCYKGSVNKNADVTLPNYTFPVMNPGVNHITFSGGITGIELNGKWWTI